MENVNKSNENSVPIQASAMVNKIIFKTNVVYCGNAAAQLCKQIYIYSYIQGESVKGTSRSYAILGHILKCFNNLENTTQLQY